MPTIRTLKNGITVANFSSPHPFVFDSGDVLLPVPEYLTKALMLKPIEREVRNAGGWTDIEIEFELTREVRNELEWYENYGHNIDIVLVPLPVMAAIKNAGLPIGKARVVRVVDRVNKIVSSEKFCV